MRYLIIVLLLLALSGCGFPKGYKEAMSSWIGADERQLLANFGPPNRAYESGGTKYLTWSSSKNVTIPGQDPYYTSTVVGNQVYTQSYGGTDDTNINLRCEFTFVIENGRVTTWRAKGNNCRTPNKRW